MNDDHDDDEQNQPDDVVEVIELDSHTPEPSDVTVIIEGPTELEIHIG